MNFLKIKLNDPKMLKTLTTLFELFPQLVAEVMSQTKKEEDGLQVYYYCRRKELYYSLQKGGILSWGQHAIIHINDAKIFISI